MKKIIIPIVIVIIVGGAAWWFISDYIDKKMKGDWSVPEGTIFEPGIEADQQFGFLIGPSADEMKLARETGAGWVRPHPGSFVWHDMQSSESSAIDFSHTDNMIKAAAVYDINILPTIWHYAEWDQKNHTNPDNCIASSGEFEREFGKYRCKPNDWEAYTNWVNAIVERYDGDGINDMPDLKKPLTHWEVMNEPDLGTPDGSPGLQFLIGQPADYAELLKKTSAVIRQADPNAKIVIAGAAGGNKMFLDYFREVFADKETHDAFDIANVHCISNDDVDTFNVKPYTAMLAEFDIVKPIWVTEAEAFGSKDPKDKPVNDIGEQLLLSSTNALANDAEKIFFTTMNVDHRPGGDKDDKSDKPDGDKDSGPQASTEIYQTIFNTL